MRKRIKKIAPFLAIVLLSGCVTLPSGPSVRVMPGQGKPFEEFRADDAVCRQWAEQQLGISPPEAVNQNVATGAIVGTVIGSGLGAAIGAASGNPGAGAAIGAGSGLLLGTASGFDAGNTYGWEIQRRYDNAYVQCMYAKGNQVPGVKQYRRVRKYTPPPPPDLRSVPPDSVPYDAPTDLQP